MRRGRADVFEVWVPSAPATSCIEASILEIGVTTIRDVPSPGGRGGVRHLESYRL